MWWQILETLRDARCSLLDTFSFLHALSPRPVAMFSVSLSITEQTFARASLKFLL